MAIFPYNCYHVTVIIVIITITAIFITIIIVKIVIILLIYAYEIFFYTHPPSQVYVELIDMAGHRYGPESSEVEEAVKAVDSALDSLWEDLAVRDMLNTVGRGAGRK